MSTSITSFEGEHRWLSNFHPVQIFFEDTLYPSVEHAYQAAKFPKFARFNFTLGTPGAAKRNGQKPGARSDWDQVKLGIMEQLLRLKFRPGSVLATKLLATNGDIVEGNHWGDVYWGVCRGVGENHLGRLLMKIREELKS